MANDKWQDRVTRGLERGANSSYADGVISGGERPVAASCACCGRVLSEASTTGYCPHCPPSGSLGAE